MPQSLKLASQQSPTSHPCFPVPPQDSRSTGELTLFEGALRNNSGAPFRSGFSGCPPASAMFAAVCTWGTEGARMDLVRETAHAERISSSGKDWYATPGRVCLVLAMARRRQIRRGHRQPDRTQATSSRGTRRCRPTLGRRLRVFRDLRAAATFAVRRGAPWRPRRGRRFDCRRASSAGLPSATPSCSPACTSAYAASVRSPWTCRRSNVGGAHGARSADRTTRRCGRFSSKGGASTPAPGQGGWRSLGLLRHFGGRGRIGASARRSFEAGRETGRRARTAIIAAAEFPSRAGRASRRPRAGAGGRPRIRRGHGVEGGDTFCFILQGGSKFNFRVN